MIPKKEDDSMKPPPELETRKINLNQINKNKLESTFWLKEQERLKLTKIDYELLLKHFAESKIKEKKETGEIQLKPKEENQKVKILDDKKLMNLGICLSKIPFKKEEIKEIFLKMDYKKFNTDNIEQLNKVLPTIEDIEAFKNFKGDIKQVSEGELFVKELISIPRIKEVIDFMTIKLSFQTDSNETIRKIKSFSEGFDCLNSSTQFQALLRYILNISNYLNSNSRYGNVIGFSLTCLNNLDSSKSFINKNYNIIDYLITNLKQNEPTILNFHKDLNLNTEIDYDDTKSSIQSVELMIKKIRKEKEIIEKLIKSEESNTSIESKEKIFEIGLYYKNYYDFLKNLEIEVCNTNDNIISNKEKMDEKINQFSLLYGEDMNKIKPDEMFKSIMSFEKKFKGSIIKLNEIENEIQRIKDKETKLNQRKNDTKGIKKTLIRKATNVKKSTKETGNLKSIRKSEKENTKLGSNLVRNKAYFKSNLKSPNNKSKISNTSSPKKEEVTYKEKNVTLMKVENSSDSEEDVSKFVKGVKK